MNDTQPTTPTALQLANSTPGNLVEAGFDNSAGFAHIQRVAKMFSQSKLVPETFQGEQGLPNCVIALEMSKRMSASPLAVMQNIYIVHGKPGWSAQFITACLNTCGRFEPLRFQLEGEGDGWQCRAWTIDKGIRLPPRSDNKPWTIERAREAGYAPYCSPVVSIGMAKKEGWFNRNGSKWQTMPELMLHYRAATFFGRLYAPELLMGMKTVEEIIDIDAETVPAGPKTPVFDGPPPATPRTKAAKVVTEAPKPPQDAPGASTPPNTPSRAESTPSVAPESEKQASGANPPTGDQPGTSDEAAEAAAGLAPEPEKPVPTAEPDPKLADRPGDTEQVKTVKRLAREAGITADALINWCRVNKLAKEGQQIGDLSTSKLESLATRWGTIVSRIKG